MRSGRVGRWSLPTILRVGGARFFFYSNEGREPPHVHVQLGSATAKFWLNPVEVASARHMRLRDVRVLAGIVRDNKNELTRAWHDFFLSR